MKLHFGNAFFFDEYVLFHLFCNKYSCFIICNGIVFAFATSAKCPAEGVWPNMDGNIDVLRKCPEGTIGMMTRFCNQTSETEAKWENVVDKYCLDNQPAPGMGYVDFVYDVSESRARFIGYRPIGFAEGIKFVYGIPKEAVSVHRIAELPDMVSTFGVC